jgi:O-antigen ligase
LIGLTMKRPQGVWPLPEPVTRLIRVAPVAVVVIVLTNGPVFLFSKSVVDRSGDWEDPAVWPFFVAAAIASAVLAAMSRSRTGPMSASQKAAAVAIAAYSLAAVASALWSVHPFATGWRASVYVGLGLLAWAVARLDPDDLASTLWLVTAAAVVGSVMLVALRPDLGLDSNDHWEGLYTNRNSLAPVAAIGVLAGIRYLAAGKRWSRATGAGLAALSMGAMAGAGSRTAWIALLIAAAAATAAVGYHRARSRWSLATARASLAVVTALGVGGASVALAALWDEATFSQRRTMWSLIWDRVSQRPLGGYGFYAFWEEIELLDHALLRRGSAHNSLMEVALGLGLVGTVPFVVIVALAVRNAGLQLWRRPGADSWMWAALVGFMLVENVTESFVLWFSYVWVLLMAAALKPIPPRERGDPAPPAGDAGHW